MSLINKSDFLSTCQTGDILLYHTTRWYSRIIEWFSGSNYSHVAMILRDPTWLHPELKGLYILESGAEDVEDTLSHRYVYGVQIIPLEHVLNKYEKDPSIGYLYYSAMNCPRTSLWQDTLREVLLKVDGCRYDINIYDWLRAGLRIHIGETHRQSQFWCSALLSYVYVQLGMLDSQTPWTLVTPRQFSSLEKETLVFTEGCSLVPERCISFAKEPMVS